MKSLRILLLSVGVVFYLSHFSYAGLNEFDISNSTVKLNEFLSGGPQKDGIPSLNSPKFVRADEADYLKESDIVVGVSVNGKAKAYPIRILNWHEIVNDNISSTPLAVTWCPLTKSAVAFDRNIGGKTLEFGVSGLLYNSNVVMYDRTNNGLWSQLKEKALTGKLASKELNIIPSVVTTWGSWQAQNPNTLVLSKKTGHWRNYNKDPYQQYHSSLDVMFPVENFDRRLPLKSVVLGVKINNVAKAYPLKSIQNLSILKDNVAGVDVQIKPIEGGTAIITDRQGNMLPSTAAYWFAWSTFNKDTLIYSP